MKKILIGVPCFNEEKNIEECINSILSIKSEHEIQILVVNDGSKDKSLEIINKLNNIKVISSFVNEGLSEVFNSLMFYAKKQNFDFLIVFDADGQYPSYDIPRIVEYAINSKSDIAIGTRDFKNNKIFSKYKNILQRLGSKIIGKILNLKILDISSGFRIYSNKAFNVLFSGNNFTYTVETLFQAKSYGLEINQIPLTEFYETRKSRLFKSNFEYIRKTINIVFKSFMLYKTSATIKSLILLFAIPGIGLLSRFFIPYFNDGFNPGNIQSLIVGIGYIAIGSIFLVYLLLKIDNVKHYSYLKKRLYEPKHY